MSYDIADIVPHSGVMSLLDTLVNYAPDSLTASVCITEHSLFAEPRGVPAWVGIEYMAQAVAAYAGALAKDNSEPVSIGFLLGSRKYLCNQAYFPYGTTLEVKVHKEIQGDNGLGVFRCEITAQDIQATANLNVFQPNDVIEYLNNERATLEHS